MGGSPGEVVIGVDIGTTSVKAVAFDVDGEAHGSGGEKYELRSPEPGHEEQDPDEIAAAVRVAVAAAARAARDGGCEVAGLAFSSVLHSLMGVDDSGRPLTPLLIWADERASEQARALRADADADAVALQRRTGTPVHPMSPLVKLRWFAEREPDLAGRVDRWIGIKEYVVAGLTGTTAVDHGVASATGLFDLAGERWDEQALELAGIAAGALSEPAATSTTLELAGEAARELELPEGLPVVLGSGDGPLANLGLGAIRPGAVACSIGTSGALRVVVDAPRVDERGRAFCYVLGSGRYAVGGAVNNGGVVLDWAADALAPDVAAAAAEQERSSAEALLELAAQAPPGSGGLLFLPYLLGERAPHWQGRPRGVYLGLTREHRREHLLRATIEGVSLQLAVVLRSLVEAGVEIREVRATGGFSRSPLWRGVLAAALGHPIGFAESPEASALGAALLGMEALGLVDSLERAADLVEVEDVEEPDPASMEVYDRLLPVFDDAYDALAAPFEAIADMQDVLPLDHPDAR
jgi:gluconokinase